MFSSCSAHSKARLKIFFCSYQHQSSRTQIKSGPNFLSEFQRTLEVFTRILYDLAHPTTSCRDVDLYFENLNFEIARPFLSWRFQQELDVWFTKSVPRARNFYDFRSSRSFATHPRLIPIQVLVSIYYIFALSMRLFHILDIIYFFRLSASSLRLPCFSVKPNNLYMQLDKPVHKFV
jgi:hypothetical protein